MRLFKCLVPVLVLLLVEDSSATLCLLRETLNIHTNTLIGRMCASKQKQLYPGNIYLNIQKGTKNKYSLELDNAKQPPHHGSNAQQNPRDTTHVKSIIQEGNDNKVTIANHNGGHSDRVPRANSASKADAYAGSSGVGGFGGNAGNTGITSGNSASSGSGLGGYGGSNGGSFGVNAKANAVASAGASSGSWTDGSAVSGTNQQAGAYDKDDYYGPTRLQPIRGGNQLLAGPGQSYANTNASANGPGNGHYVPKGETSVYANAAANAGSQGKVNQFPMMYPSQGIAVGQYAALPEWPFNPLVPLNMRNYAHVQSIFQERDRNVVTVGNHNEGYSDRVRRANSASKADAYAGSCGVGGFGGNAGNTGITSGNSASSGSGLGGYGGSNGGSFGVNAKFGNRADGSTVSGANG